MRIGSRVSSVYDTHVVPVTTIGPAATGVPCASVASSASSSASDCTSRR